MAKINARMMAIKKAPPPRPAPFNSETKLDCEVTPPTPAANRPQKPRTFFKEGLWPGNFFKREI